MALRRAKRGEFAEFQKMKQVRDYIDQNPMLFVADMEFDVNLILHRFRVFEPNYATLTPEQIITAHASHSNKRCQWQNRFNRVLAQRGMYMTKRYKENLFHIRNDEEVQSKIQAFSRDSRRKRARGNELRNGFSGYHNTYVQVPNNVLREIVENGNPADWSNTDYVDPDRT